MFSETNVSKIVGLLMTFAESEGLGAPVKVFSRDEMFMTGIGCEWASGMRNAVVIRGDTATEDAKEAKRRLNEWVMEGTRERMWADMDAGTFSLSDIS